MNGSNILDHIMNILLLIQQKDHKWLVKGLLHKIGYSLCLRNGQLIHQQLELTPLFMTPIVVWLMPEIMLVINLKEGQEDTKELDYLGIQDMKTTKDHQRLIQLLKLILG